MKIIAQRVSEFRSTLSWISKVGDVNLKINQRFTYIFKHIVMQGLEFSMYDFALLIRTTADANRFLQLQIGP